MVDVGKIVFSLLWVCYIFGEGVGSDDMNQLEVLDSVFAYPNRVTDGENSETVIFVGACEYEVFAEGKLLLV